MLDAGVLVGYLTVFLLRGSRRFADRTFDKLLDKLAGRLVDGLGQEPLNDLRTGPGKPEVEEWVASRLDGAMRNNPKLARDLGNVVDELDARGGWGIVQNVYAHEIGGSVIGGHLTIGDHSTFVGGDYVYAPHPNDFSGAPLVAKVLVGIGVVLLLAGVALAGVALYDYSQQPPGPRPAGMPAGLPQAAVVFFSGLVAMAIGGVVKSFSPDRHR
jgi:hypothetical protein